MASQELAKFRDHHHRIAFRLAGGKRPGEVAEEFGVSRSRISQLKATVEFQNLIDKYRTQQDIIEFNAFRQVAQVMAGVQLMAAEELRDRLEESPEDFSTRELIEIFADMSDRLGHSKVSRQESKNLSVNIDLADSLAEARRREQRLASDPSADAGGLVTAPAEPAPQ